VPRQTQFKIKNSQRNSFILSAANFLTGFCKSKVYTFIALRCAKGFVKTISIRLPADSILSTKTLLLQNPVSRPGCYDKNERGSCRFYISSIIKIYDYGNDNDQYLLLYGVFGYCHQTQEI